MSRIFKYKIKTINDEDLEYKIYTQKINGTCDKNINEVKKKIINIMNELAIKEFGIKNPKYEINIVATGFGDYLCGGDNNSVIYVCDVI